MKILLLNDTRNETNPGCHATVTGLTHLIQLKTPDVTIDTIESGYGYHYFSNVKAVKKKSLATRVVEKIRRTFFKKQRHPHKYTPHPVDYFKWIDAVNHWRENDPVFIEKISASDIVIINMEGTIHHNRAGALTLIGAARIAKSMNKKVYMVNGTIQALDRFLLDELKTLDYVAVREPLSYEYLQGNGIKAVQSADCAFLANISSQEGNLVRDINITSPRRCLFTAGVLAAFPTATGKISYEDVWQQIQLIRSVGYEVDYLKIEQAESQLETYLLNHGVGMVSSDWNSIGDLIRKYNLVVSGRYHVAIFAIMNNIPVISRTSNTWKIEGLQRLAGHSIHIADTLDTLNDKLNHDTYKPCDTGQIKTLAQRNMPA